MIETDAAYIAGIVDGEGCIALHRSHYKRDKRRGGHVIYNPRVRVTNTDKYLVEWLCVTTGLGKVRPMKMYTKNRKQAYDWYVSGKIAGEFISDILPYLKVKRLQAEIVLRYCETLLDRKDCIRGSRLPQNVVLLREELQNRMHSLNGHQELCGCTNLP